MTEAIHFLEGWCRIKNMTYNVEIVDRTYGEVTRHSDPDSQWDNDDTCTSHDIRGFKVTKDYYDLTVEFEPNYDKTYFLLYATYSTGNSFSHHEGEIEFVDLFEDENVAYENLRRLERHKEGYSVKLLHESGEEYSFSVPWIGYFESLSDLEVMAIRRQ